MSSRDEPAGSAPKLTFRPVTEATREGFLAVFAKGGPSYCWCMAYRATTEELKAGRGPARRTQMLGRIKKRVPVGLIGYDDGEPVAWVSVAPKSTFRGIGGPEPEAGQTVWSLSCMYLKRSHRKAGLGHALIAAAIAQAKKRGADMLEAYPVDPDSPSYRHMGFVPAYEKAGFAEVAREGSRRHVMQLKL